MSLQDELADPFEISVSSGGDVQTGVAPDASICDDCVAELSDPTQRRHSYPFLNCTNCGPRFSVISGIPYDRSNTTMDEFDLCSNCKSEYSDISDRRYHEQPIACAACGQKIWLESASGGQGPLMQVSGCYSNLPCRQTMVA